MRDWLLHSDPIRTVASRVAQAYGYDLGDIVSPCRAQPLVMVRNEAMWECRRKHRESVSAIARFFNRDRSSVLNGIRKHEQRVMAHG